MEWFETWFDSEYYHILYKSRDEKEAEYFIQNLIEHLKLDKEAKVLDLACGKGRHAEILAKNNFNTIGVDLSENSINEAKKLEKKNLHFFTHDMRLPIDNKFDAIFNLFTSFGYFSDTSENLKVLKSIETMLNINGVVIIDFMNAEKVIRNLVKKETKVIDNIQFEIERSVENGIITKSISFEDKGQYFKFYECVQALTLNDFKQIIEKTTLKIKSTFGDYKLSKYNPESSDRLILELVKK